MRVLYISHLLERSGWGQASRDFLDCMDSVGIDVVPRAVEMDGPYEKLSDRHQELLKKSSKNCDIVIQHVLPHLYEYNGNFKKNIGMYYSESGELNYTSFFSYLNMMDELWVPSQGMVKEGVQSGVRTKYKVINHPVDINKYTVEYPKFDIPECAGDYKFYFIGEGIRKKHLTAALRAFHTEFAFNEPVQLIIKSKRPGLDNAESANFINEQCKTVKENLKLYDNQAKYKAEIIITSSMSNENVYSLHQFCDCLIVPSYGEAINLPAIDAIGFGNKVICTDSQGTEEFVSEANNGYLVKSHLADCFGMTEGFNDMYSSRESCRDIDVGELRKSMRKAYLCRENNIADLSNFSYQRIGELIKKELQIEPSK